MIEKKISAFVKTNYVGSKVEEVITVYLNGDETPEEIEQACEATAREWMFENIEWGFENPEDDETDD